MVDQPNVEIEPVDLWIFLLLFLYHHDQKRIDLFLYLLVVTLLGINIDNADAQAVIVFNAYSLVLSPAPT